MRLLNLQINITGRKGDIDKTPTLKTTLSSRLLSITSKKKKKLNTFGTNSLYNVGYPCSILTLVLVANFEQ